MDYLYLDSEALQTGTVEGGALQVGNFSFTTVIVPNCSIMRLEDLRVLEKMIEGGANVVFGVRMPEIAVNAEDQAELETLVSAHESKVYKSSDPALVKAVKAHTRVALTVESEQTVYVSPYEKDGVKFYFLANASDQDASVTLHCEKAVGYRIYDPVTG